MFNTSHVVMIRTASRLERLLLAALHLEVRHSGRCARRGRRTLPPCPASVSASALAHWLLFCCRGSCVPVTVCWHGTVGKSSTPARCSAARGALVPLAKTLSCPRRPALPRMCRAEALLEDVADRLNVLCQNNMEPQRVRVQGWGGGGRGAEWVGAEWVGVLFERGRRRVGCRGVSASHGLFTAACSAPPLPPMRGSHVARWPPPGY